MTNIQLAPLQEMTKPCIYALVHPQKKMVYLAHTTNLLESLVRLFKNLDSPTPNYSKLSLDRNDLDLVILEEEDSPEIRRIHLKKWCDEYRNTGYTTYNNPKYVEYKTKIEVDHFNKKVEVRLVNRRRDFTCIETFDTIEEAKEFLSRTTLERLIEKYLVKTSSSRMSETNDADIESL